MMMNCDSIYSHEFYTCIGQHNTIFVNDQVTLRVSIYVTAKIYPNLKRKTNKNNDKVLSTTDFSLLDPIQQDQKSSFTLVPDILWVKVPKASWNRCSANAAPVYGAELRVAAAVEDLDGPAAIA